MIEVRWYQLLLLIKKVAFILILAAFPASAMAEPTEAGWQALAHQAELDFKQGQLERAEQTWRAALKEADDAKCIAPGTVDCLRGLAFVNERRGNRGEAERIYELAMRNLEAVAGRDSPQFADWLPDLAMMYDAHGHPEKAEVLFLHALRVKERVYGVNDPRLADTLDGYARFLRKNARPIEANAAESRAEKLRAKAW